MVVQLAFSVLLVTCAGLAYRSLFLVGGFESGFDTRSLLLVSVNTGGSAANAQTNAVLVETLRTRLGGVPGVQRVSYATQPPRELWGTDEVRIPGASNDPVRVETTLVGPNYLETLGVHLLAGRDPSREGSGRTTAAAMISQNLANERWPGQSPIGRRLILGDRGQPQLEVDVIGVMPDRYYSGFRRAPPRFVFLSWAHEPGPPGEITLYVKFTGTFDATGRAIARALQEIDPGTAIVMMRTWDMQIDSGIWPVRALTTLLMLFAGGSLFIAAIGQYALVSFDMRRRVRELGLRMALGASPRWTPKTGH